ncbi:MAG: hypothetical protein KC417_17300, partial [Myxococcales bacterium]|nr:hypothetical protein [Myxococcales bacterium]
MPNARALVSLLPLLLACTGSTSGAAGAGDGGMNTNDAKVHMGHDAAVDAVTPLSDAAVDVAEGDVSGDWCGQVMVSGTVTIPTGQSLTICAGSDVRFANDAKLRVDGTLTLDGSASAPIKLGLDSTWGGIRV